MTIKDWIQTYARELEGSDAERELEAIVNTPVKIMGKSVDEICVILSALELERLADMKMTMSYLDYWMKKVRDEHHKAMQKAINSSLRRYQSNLLKAIGESDGSTGAAPSYTIPGFGGVKDSLDELTIRKGDRGDE